MRWRTNLITREGIRATQTRKSEKTEQNQETMQGVVIVEGEKMSASRECVKREACDRDESADHRVVKSAREEGTSSTLDTDASCLYDIAASLMQLRPANCRFDGAESGKNARLLDGGLTLGSKRGACVGYGCAVVRSGRLTGVVRLVGVKDCTRVGFAVPNGTFLYVDAYGAAWRTQMGNSKEVTLYPFFPSLVVPAADWEISFAPLCVFCAGCSLCPVSRGVCNLETKCTRYSMALRAPLRGA